MADAATNVTGRGMPWIGLVVGLAATAWHNRVLQPWTLDDAYISFRYAENFAAGHGLVYNPGEWVEGYTTFAWVFLLGLGNLLGADTRVLAKVLGATFAAATLLLVSQAHRFDRRIPPTASGFAAAALGSCGVFSAWAMPGMEVPLVSFALTATALLVLRLLDTGRGAVLAGLAATLAWTSRPDSVVLLGVLALATAIEAYRTKNPRSLLPWGVLGALYGPYFAWRLWAYGYLLPNTFYAKVGATGAQLSRGLDYVGAFAVPAAALLICALLLVPLARRSREVAVPAGLLAGGFVVHGLYVVSVGGDVMPAFRFFTGVLPCLAIVAGLAVSRVPRLVWAALPLVVAYNLWQFEAHPDLHSRIERGVVGLRGEEVGLWLRDNVAPDALLATNTAGSVPYFSGLRTIDMLGLNDSHIAHREMPGMGKGKAGHEKADGAYVFSREPDYVQFGSARGRKKPAFRSDRELYRQPGFQQRYVLQHYRLPSGATLVLWVKRDLLDSGEAPRGR